MEGPLYDVLSRLLKAMIKINIIVPGDFKSHRELEAVKCSVKAQEGFLYPLQKSLIFIHKPVTYIKIDDVLHVEFARVSEFAKTTVRSFDLTVTTKKGESTTFTGIDKQEYKPLRSYLQKKNLRIRNIDEDG